MSTTEHTASRLGANAAAPPVAPMWRRLVARLIDVVAVAVWMLALGIAYVLFHLQLWSDTVAPEPWGRSFLALMTFFVMYAVYEVAFITRSGATPGKDLMRLRVVSEHDGGHPTTSQALRRWLLPGIVQPIPWFWPGILLTLGWGATGIANPERRTVHDRFASTRVVFVPRGEEQVDDEEEQRRKGQFRPRFFDPFETMRIARSEPERLMRRRRIEGSTGEEHGEES